MDKKLYIKDNNIFLADTAEYFFPIEIENIEIPKDSKNHLVNNKILISDIQKLKNKETKKIELTKKIDDFDDLKSKISKLYINDKNKFKTPKSDDYDFIEKTSQIEIIDGILKNYMTNTNSFDTSDNNINNYIKSIKSLEKQKFAQVEEQIEIENSKLLKINQEKEEFKIENIDNLLAENEKSNKKLKLLENKKTKLDDYFTKKLDLTNNDSKIEKINEKINDYNSKIKENEMNVEILNAKIKTLKNNIKLGKTKSINIFLFIITLGLIYWTKYSDSKYQLLKLTEKKNKQEERNLIYKKNIFKLEKILDKKSSQNQKNNVKTAKEEEDIQNQIDDLDVKITALKIDIKKFDEEIKLKSKDLKKFDIDIDKINNKIIELTSIHEEFKKYSTDKLKKEFDLLKGKKQSQLKKLEDLKKQLKSQVIDIKGEWIIAIE